MDDPSGFEANKVMPFAPSLIQLMSSVDEMKKIYALGGLRPGPGFARETVSSVPVGSVAAVMAVIVMVAMMLTTMVLITMVVAVVAVVMMGEVREMWDRVMMVVMGTLHGLSAVHTDEADHRKSCKHREQCFHEILLC